MFKRSHQSHGVGREDDESALESIEAMTGPHPGRHATGAASLAPTLSDDGASNPASALSPSLSSGTSDDEPHPESSPADRPVGNDR